MTDVGKSSRHRLDSQKTLVAVDALSNGDVVDAVVVIGDRQPPSLDCHYAFDATNPARQLGPTRHPPLSKSNRMSIGQSIQPHHSTFGAHHVSTNKF